MLNYLNPYPMLRRDLEQAIEAIFQKHGEMLLELNQGVVFAFEIRRTIPVKGGGEFLTIELYTGDLDSPDQEMRDVIVKLDSTNGLQLTMQSYLGSGLRSATVQTGAGFRLGYDDIEWAVHDIFNHMLDLPEETLRAIFKKYYHNKPAINDATIHP